MVPTSHYSISAGQFTFIHIFKSFLTKGRLAYSKMSLPPLFGYYKNVFVIQFKEEENVGKTVCAGSFKGRHHPR